MQEHKFINFAKLSFVAFDVWLFPRASLMDNSSLLWRFVACFSSVYSMLHVILLVLFCKILNDFYLSCCTFFLKDKCIEINNMFMCLLWRRCVLFMKWNLGQISLQRPRGSRYKKIGLVPTWKGHATCGKFFKTLLVKRPLRKLPMWSLNTKFYTRWCE
jgi:hypothetical protein